LTKGCISQQWVVLECTACFAPIAACSMHIRAWSQTVKPEQPWIAIEPAWMPSTPQTKNFYKKLINLGI